MKKFNVKSITAVTAAVMAISAMAAPMSAFADTSEKTFNYSATDQTGNIAVTYSNAPTFTVTIPADVSFTTLGETKSGSTLSASDVFLAHGKVVTVSIASANGYQMKNTDTTDTTSYIGYTLSATSTNATVADAFSTGVSSGTTSQLLATFANGNAATKGSGTVNLTFVNDDGSHAVAGSYADTLTFTIAVADAT